MTTKELFDEMQDPLISGAKFPYKNAASLSRELRKLKPELKGWIEVTGPEKIEGGNNKTFWQIKPGSKLVVVPNDPQEGQPE